MTLVVIYEFSVLIWKVSQEDVVLDILGNLATTRHMQMTHTQCIVGEITECKYMYEEVPLIIDGWSRITQNS